MLAGSFVADELGDTGTPEQRIATDALGRAFEVCMTINGSWGYNANDNRYKSSQQLIRNLSDITSKGGSRRIRVRQPAFRTSCLRPFDPIRLFRHSAGPQRRHRAEISI